MIRSFSIIACRPSLFIINNNNNNNYISQHRKSFHSSNGIASERSHLTYISRDSRWHWQELKTKVFGRVEHKLHDEIKPKLVDRYSDTVAYVPEAEEDEMVYSKPEAYPTMAQMQTLPPPEEGLYQPKLPLPVIPNIDSAGYSNGYGRRKTAKALVAIRPGTGRIIINGKHWLEYFPNLHIRGVMLEPVIAAEKIHQLDIKITTKGGGFMGQSYAIRQAIANALVARDPELRYLMDFSRLRKFDGRKKERKHTGRRGARRRQQWVKR